MDLKIMRFYNYYYNYFSLTKSLGVAMTMDQSNFAKRIFICGHIPIGYGRIKHKQVELDNDDV